MSSNGRPLSDDEIVEVLERRAGHAKVDPRLLSRTLALAGSERQARSSMLASAIVSARRARSAAGALVAAAAVVSLVGGALFVGGSRSIPVPSASQEASPLAGIEAATILTTQRLQELLETGLDDVVGNVVLVEASLGAMECEGAQPCSIGFLRGPSPRIVLVRGADSPTIGSGISGTFALRVIDPTHVQWVGQLVRRGSQPTWTPHELRAYRPPSGPDLYAVTGWLVPASQPPCPSPPDGTPGCQRRPPQLVDDQATARTLLGGHKVESLLLESVAEGVLGASNGTEQSEPGTYLVRAAVKGCNDMGRSIPDCFVPPNAPILLFIDARVDPIAQTGRLSVAPSAALSSTTPRPTSSETDWSSVTVLPPVVEPFVGTGNTFVNGIAPLGAGFVAAGYTLDPSDSRVGLVWTSPDGRSWSRSAPPVVASVALDTIVTTGDRVVVAGRSGETQTSRGVERLFASTDGRTWTEGSADDLGSSDQVLVAAGPVGFVALGASGESWQEWVSSDGVSWQRGDLSGVPKGNRLSLGGGSAGYVIAVEEGTRTTGVGGPLPDDAHVELAVSKDARSWTTVPLVGVTRAGQISVGDHVLAVLGSTSRCGGCVNPPAGWMSGDDGRTWKIVEPALGIQDQLFAGAGRIFVWTQAGAGTSYGLRSTADGISWLETDVRVIDDRNPPNGSLGFSWFYAGPSGIVIETQTEDEPAHQTVSFAQPGPPPPGAIKPSARPMPSDHPCSSPDPTDVGGACGP